LVGRKLSLFVALAVAAVGFAIRRRNPRVPTFRETMMMLFNCVAALTGVCTICIDPKAGERFASVIEPLTALGPDHVASFMHQFCLNLAATVRDRVAEARENWARMLERLDRPEALRELPQNVHVLYLAGALFAQGVIESWLEEGRELEHADRLDGFKLKLYELSADQLRMMHYGNRGHLELFQRYRERVEMHAIQRGTAWQVETWTFSQLMNIYLRWGYVAGLKECTEPLKRLSAEVPTLRTTHARAVGAYLLLRGSPKEALDWLDRDERPLEIVGWARGQGLRARAYNDLGDHREARETCLRALETVDPRDLEFCVMNLILEIELARAEAGLGQAAEATARLRGLLVKYERAGDPLTLGPIHEAMASLAAARGDTPAFEESLREVERWFRASGNPALVARYERLARMAASTGQPLGDRSSDRAPRMLTLVHKLKHGGDHSVEGSARWALGQLARYAGVNEAYLFASDGEGVRCAAQIGDEAPDLAALTPWVDERLRALEEADGMATSTASGEMDQNRLEVGGVLFHLTPLLLLGEAVGAVDPVQEVVGGIVTRGEAAVPFAVLQSIAERIRSTARSSATTSLPRLPSG
jgi:tetratricopeptide (TPR) repeat protein